MHRNVECELPLIDSILKVNKFIVFILILCSACDRSGGSGSEVISQEKFVDVLVEVRLLEAAYSVKFDKVDSTAGIASYYKTLFQQQGTTKEQFESSYKFYAARRDQMIEIEEVVLEKISIKNTEARKILESEPQAPADTARINHHKDTTDYGFRDLKK
jgi:hypothetical protein